jgi:hypothetical protein
VVENTGTPLCADTSRPVNTPEALKVDESPAGLPLAVRMPRREKVAVIEDRWRLDDEWWRAEPLSRMYYNVLLSSGMRLIFYKDLTGGGWYRQEY